MKRSNPVQVTLQDIIRRKSCKLVEPAFNFSGFTVINTPPDGHKNTFIEKFIKTEHVRGNVTFYTFLRGDTLNFIACMGLLGCDYMMCVKL